MCHHLCETSTLKNRTAIVGRHNFYQLVPSQPKGGSHWQVGTPASNLNRTAILKAAQVFIHCRPHQPKDESHWQVKAASVIPIDFNSMGRIILPCLQIMCMKNRLSLLLPALLTIAHLNAQQVGINTDTPHVSAALDISSTSKGMLVPRLTQQQRLDIAVPAKGLLVFDSTSNSFWYRDGDAWQELLQSTRAWKLSGNSGTDTSIHFIGTTDEQPLVFKVNNSRSGIIDYTGNTSFGYRSLGFNGSVFNTATGILTLYANTTGSYNTATGGGALSSNTEGEQNVATGFQAMSYNTTGSYNTANGRAALFANISGRNNTAIGYTALQSNITGQSNVAIGFRALLNCTNRNFLVAIGDSALYNNGNDAIYDYEAAGNTAVGSKSLFSNTKGYENTADGYNALYSSTTGYANTANGYQALYSNTSGTWNTANGHTALYSNTTGYGNTANGRSALTTNTTGFLNTGLGNGTSTGSNLSYATAIGAGATSGCSNCLVLGGNGIANRTKVGINISSPLTDLQIIQQSDAAGNTSRGIRLQRSTNTFWRTYVDGVSALTFEYNNGGAGSWGWINTSGSFVDGSDARGKKNIRPSENVLDKLILLQPKKYQFNPQAENEKFTYGFVAQEVQQVFPEFVNEREGGMLGITYGSFGVIAVKAIQEQQVQLDRLTKDNEALRLQLQKMMGLINTLNEKVGALAVK